MSADPSPPPGERLAKVLARAGVASRRAAEEMIRDGKVAVTARPWTAPR
jgi:23S rRNA pseudouridine2605 synthase